MAYVPSTIISAPSASTAGDFTPGAAWSMNMIASILNAAWNQAGKQEYDYTALINSITDEETGWLSTTAAPQIAGVSAATLPTVAEPALTIPTEINTSAILSDYHTEYEALLAKLVDYFATFKNTHFAQDAALYSAGETWVANAIANGGLPVTVQNQITDDDHARISRESTHAVETLRQSYAAMRFPLPPGAMASAELQIYQKEQDLMAESSRKITILSVDMMKFAIENMEKMRQLAMSSTIDYVKTLVMGPDISSKVIGIGLDAQPKLISAVSGLIGARTEVQKLVSSVNEFNVTTDLQVKEKNQAADMGMIDNRLKALLSHCQSLAQQITAALNNMHVSGGSAYNVNGT